MVLKARLSKEEYDKLNDIEKGHYKEGSNGIFGLDVDPVDGWALEDVQGLRSALQSERNERSKLDGRLSSFSKIEDPKKALEALQKVKEMEKWTPEEEVQKKIDAQIASMKAKYEGDLSEANTRNEQTQKEFEKYVKREAAVAAISRVAPKSVSLLLPHVLDRLGVVQEGDKRSVYVFGDDGKPKISQKPGNTGSMTPGELLESMAKESDFSPAFPGSGATGSGATGSENGASTSRNGIDPNLPPAERLKQFRAQQKS